MLWSAYALGTRTLVSVCSRNTNVIMVWAWMLWSAYALGTRTLLWFGDALVSVCSRNTNVIMVWAWTLWSAYALGTRTLVWFEHGCFGQRMLSAHERYYGLGMDALVTVCSRNTNAIMVWAWMLWSPYALGTRTLLWFEHGCFGHRMLSAHERYYGLSMDALVSVCSRRTNVIMVWAWMLWSAYALGTRTLLWFGDALVSVCSRNTNVIMVWAWMLWSAYALGTRTLLWFAHGCFGQRMLSEHERYYGLGMDALVTVCSRNTNVVMVWAWMLWSQRMLSEHERYDGLGMDALVSVCSRNTNDVMDAI